MVLGDVSEESVQKELIEGTMAQFNRIDVLVNNAGMSQVGGWEETTTDMLREQLEMHIVAPFKLSQMAIPQLIANKGCIVNISSVAGLRGVSSLFLS